ncbi:MAG: lipopolysaccharide biosynthesis protein [Pirellulales bacterium]|nr:lipopolysaccharide biosynthesis protein [Pirellulales bacterium]
MAKTRVYPSPSLQAASDGAPATHVGSSSREHFVEKSASNDGASSSFSRALQGISAWGLVDQMVVSVTSFIASACVGRVCGSSELGIYSLAVIIFWLVAGIPNALVWMPYTSRAPRMNVARRRFYLGSVTAHLVLVAALVSLALLMIGFVPWPGLAQSRWFLPMCAALAPFSVLMMLREHLRRILLAHMNTSGLLLVDIPIATCQLSVLALLVWSQRLSAVTALLGMAVGGTWALLWMAWHHDRFRFERHRVQVHWGYNFQFGKWLLVVSIAWLLGDASYRWLVGSIHGLSALGQYAAAVTTVMFFNPILLTVQNLSRSLLANGLAQGGRQALWQMAVKGTRLITVGFGILFLALAVFGGRLVTLFFREEFSGLGDVVAALCLGTYLYVLSIPVEAALASLQEGRALLVTSLIRLGLILLAGVPLIVVYGPLGVGLTMAVSSCGAGVAQWFMFRQRCRNVG